MKFDMKKNLMIVLAAVTAVTMLAGGCVPIEDLHECQAANRRVRTLLEETETSLQTAGAENQGRVPRSLCKTCHLGCDGCYITIN